MENRGEGAQPQPISRPVAGRERAHTRTPGTHTPGRSESTDMLHPPFDRGHTYTVHRPCTHPDTGCVHAHAGHTPTHGPCTQTRHTRTARSRPRTDTDTRRLCTHRRRLCTHTGHTGTVHTHRLHTRLTHHLPCRHTPCTWVWAVSAQPLHTCARPDSPRSRCGRSCTRTRSLPFTGTRTELGLTLAPPASPARARARCPDGGSRAPPRRGGAGARRARARERRGAARLAAGLAPRRGRAGRGGARRPRPRGAVAPRSARGAAPPPRSGAGSARCLPVHAWE